MERVLLGGCCGEPLDKERRPFIAFWCVMASVIFALIGAVLAFYGVYIPPSVMMITLVSRKWAPTIRFVLFLITLVCLKTSFLLIVGLWMRKRWLLLPWAILSTISFIGICFDFALFIIMFCFIGGAIGGTGYLIYSVLFLYKKFGEEERTPKPRSGSITPMQQQV